MTKVWTDKAENELDYEITKRPAAIYVNSKRKHCPICKNHETIIRDVIIDKQFDMNYVKLVLKCIQDNNLIRFDTDDIMRLMNIVDVSNGALQGKALAILIMKGYIRKEIITYEKRDKNNEIIGVKQKFIFYKNDNIVEPTCYDKGESRHIDNWGSEGIVT